MGRGAGRWLPSLASSVPPSSQRARLGCERRRGCVALDGDRISADNSKINHPSKTCPEFGSAALLQSCGCVSRPTAPGCGCLVFNEQSSLAGVFVNMIHGCIVASTERSEHLSISGEPAAWQLAPLASPRAPCTPPPPQDSASPWGPWAWTQLPFASAEPGWKSEATLHTASGTVSQKAFEEDPQSPGPDWATGSREQGMTRGRQHPSRPPLSPCVPPSSWWKGAKTPPGGSVGNTGFAGEREAGNGVPSST